MMARALVAGPLVVVLCLSGAQSATPPVNDNLAKARELCCYPDASPAPFTIDDRAATTQPGEDTTSTCGTVGHTVWFKLHAPTWTVPVWPLLVTTNGSDHETIIVAYRQRFGVAPTFGSLTSVGCSASPAPDTPAAVAFNADLPAFDYYFQVGGKGAASGARLIFTYQTNI